MSTTPLSSKMRALAHERPEHAEELRRLADEFDTATERHYATKSPSPETGKRMLGAWARARKLYCALTGEPLV